MRLLLAAILACTSGLALGQTSDPDAPRGKLPDIARPTAYRIDLTVLPDLPTFTGRDEIDLIVNAPTKRLYMHGKDLKVASAVARVGGREIPARWTDVDASGVVRLDFASDLPAGPVTLAFSYEGRFRDSPSGIYRVKVADKWYAWSQFQSIDARAAFPSFDEPGFKTPFTISITTRAGEKAVSNAPEVKATPAAGLVRHQFATTKPLPTYLVAVVAGPFVDQRGTVPPSQFRKTPLPLGTVATQAQAGKLDYATKETPRIVDLLERYFGQAFPFEKLDQIASPIMPGAMENAGADIYADPIILLENGAPTGQRQAFGMVVAHELSHQWFGDFVSPAWWDDLWLNESFANWMGYRIGNEWRPELNIGVGALAEGFEAMNLDALEVGRPIHQPIATNGEIDSAFDAITYGKGGHVISMIAAYLGDETFRNGVRLHLSRHPYGNATTDQFFQALADAAKDPRLVATMRSFVDQQGVPLIDFKRVGDKLVVSQSRYAFLGGTPAAKSWLVPLCLSDAGQRRCSLLDKPSTTIASAGLGFVPNAGGTGYYRFNLEPADWQALLARAAALPTAEAIAVEDSIWAGFRAGKVPPAMIVQAVRAFAGHADSLVAFGLTSKLSALRRRGVIPASFTPAYAELMRREYAPKLTAVGFDPRSGAYASEAPERLQLREGLVDLLVNEGDDPALRTRLNDAAKRYLGGDAGAMDPAYLGIGLAVFAEENGLSAAQTLFDQALASEDALFRGAALGAVASSGRAEVADWLIGKLDDPRLRSSELISLVVDMAAVPGTRDKAEPWALANFDRLLTAAGGVFGASSVYRAFGYGCSAEAAAAVDGRIGPRVRAAGAAVLPFDRMIENIRHCAALKAAKGAELGQAL